MTFAAGDLAEGHSGSQRCRPAMGIIQDTYQGHIRVGLWLSGDDPGLGAASAAGETGRDREQAGVQSVGRLPQSRGKGLWIKLDRNGSACNVA